MNSKNYKEAMNDVKVSNKLKRETLEKINEKKYSGFRIIKFASVMCVFVFTIVAVTIMYNPNKTINTIPSVNTKLATTKDINLPTVGTYENLIEILEKNENNYSHYYDDFLLEDMAVNSTMQNASTAKGESNRDTTISATNTESINSTADYSNTNVQVQGVDEADIIKTNGKNIFYLSEEYNNYGVFIIDTETNEIVNKIEYKNLEGRLQEMFLYNDKLVVISSTYGKAETTRILEEEEKRDLIYISNPMVIATVYDISNVKDVKQIRKVEIEGIYLSSRMINDNFYMISSKELYNYNSLKHDLRPICIDSIVEDVKYTDYEDIYYFPDSEESNYLNIISLSLNNEEEANLKTFLGAGTNVYCSENNLYITKTDYKYNEASKYRYIEETGIYKLSLNGTNLVLEAETKLEGSIKNQFSLDEYKGNLRIALTAENELGDTINNLYVLDDKLEVIGKIENMAVEEKIYSVRFIGNKGYIVTFKQVDPLFVIDLAEPTNPKIAGELKIPGYSSYLHPYDENHIIGIGFNTKPNGYGGIMNDGLKMSMFDVSDPENPTEMFNISIGNSYTSSEATYNHKSILFSKEKNIIAFSTMSYGNTPFSEAIVYGIDLDDGFIEKGKISNNDENSREYFNYRINRIIYVKNNFYTFSNVCYKVTDMNTFDKIKTVKYTEE